MSGPAQVDSWDYSGDDDWGDPDGGWDDGFGRGWTAAQNAVPDCCLHGEDCPRRRPEPRWRAALRRWFGGEL